MIILPKGTERELLLHLLFNGPKIGNKISEIQNASRTAKKLEKKGFVTRTAGIHDFSPQPAMRLSFTMEGLAIALLTFFMKDGAVRLLDRNTLDTLYNIVKLWNNHIPEVFGKWALFRRENVEHIAAGRLVYASFSVVDRTESMGRAGHLWSPVKRDITNEEHMVVVFTRFFYDLIYGPTFTRVAYLAKWIASLRKPDLDIRDSPLLRWVEILKSDTNTQKHVVDNIRISQAEIRRLEILSSLLGHDTADIGELEMSLVMLMRVFYS